ncbi:hypothetical protein [Flavobacterium sp.]|uniref:hypothetical protein n=1 Tax=Flavobacterium sp. TaxID=239 RepID=UPI0026365784|nr:hypothetical protein [Flavobacterium sp.]
MKKHTVKSMLCIGLLAAGITLTSCKEKSPEEVTGVDPVPETLEPMEPSYDDGTDTIMTETDTITKVNRENDDFELHKQVP